MSVSFNTLRVLCITLLLVSTLVAGQSSAQRTEQQQQKQPPQRQPQQELKQAQPTPPPAQPQTDELARGQAKLTEAVLSVEKTVSGKVNSVHEELERGHATLQSALAQTQERQEALIRAVEAKHAEIKESLGQLLESLAAVSVQSTKAADASQSAKEELAALKEKGEQASAEGAGSAEERFESLQRASTAQQDHIADLEATVKTLTLKLEEARLAQVKSSAAIIEKLEKMEGERYFIFRFLDQQKQTVLSFAAKAFAYLKTTVFPMIQDSAVSLRTRLSSIVSIDDVRQLYKDVVVPNAKRVFAVTSDLVRDLTDKGIDLLSANGVPEQAHQPIVMTALLLLVFITLTLLYFLVLRPLAWLTCGVLCCRFCRSGAANKKVAPGAKDSGSPASENSQQKSKKDKKRQ